MFAKNTEGLLQQRPVRGARVIALDPGYRAGCKVAVLDEYGKLLDHTILYPTPPRRDIAGTKRELLRLTRKHRINTIVVGNGTASRETEEVVAAFIAESAPRAALHHRERGGRLGVLGLQAGERRSTPSST